MTESSEEPLGTPRAGGCGSQDGLARTGRGHGGGEGPWEGARLDPPHPWRPMERGMKGRRPWLSLACGCCCGDTGSTPALPISHTFPLSRSFTAQMLSCPVPARPSPTAAAPGTASPRPAHPGWLGRCANAIPVPPARWESSTLGASQPQEPGAVAGTGERRGKEGTRPGSRSRPSRGAP